MSAAKKPSSKSADKKLNPIWIEKGKRLKSTLKEAGLTQAKLLDLINGLYDPDYISKIATGHKNLSVSFAETVAPYLNVDPRYLLCETNYKNEKERTTDIGFQTHLFAKANVFLSACGFTLVKDLSEDSRHQIKSITMIGSKIRESYYSVSDTELIETVDRLMGLVGAEMRWLLLNRAQRSTKDEFNRAEAILEEKEVGTDEALSTVKDMESGKMTLEKLALLVSSKEQ